jgi:hypothetical protein
VDPALSLPLISFLSPLTPLSLLPSSSLSAQRSPAYCRKSLAHCRKSPAHCRRSPAHRRRSSPHHRRSPTHRRRSLSPTRCRPPATRSGGGEMVAVDHSVVVDHAASTCRSRPAEMVVVDHGRLDLPQRMPSRLPQRMSPLLVGIWRWLTQSSTTPVVLYCWHPTPAPPRPATELPIVFPDEILHAMALHGRYRNSSAPPPAIASTRALRGLDLCFWTRLLFIFLFRDPCVKVLILNSPKQPNNIPTQLVSTSPGYQTH